MRKLWIALVICALFVALPATAGGATLRKRVAKLEDKMACLKRTPMSTYLGYAYYEGVVGDPPPFPVHDPSTDLVADSNVAASFDQLFTGSPGPADYWVAVVRNTSACRSKFDVSREPVRAQGGPARRLDGEHAAPRPRALRIPMR